MTDSYEMSCGPLTCMYGRPAAIAAAMPWWLSSITMDGHLSRVFALRYRSGWGLGLPSSPDSRSFTYKPNLAFQNIAMQVSLLALLTTPMKKPSFLSLLRAAFSLQSGWQCLL